MYVWLLELNLLPLQVQTYLKSRTALCVAYPKRFRVNFMGVGILPNVDE